MFSDLKQIIELVIANCIFYCPHSPLLGLYKLDFLHQFKYVFLFLLFGLFRFQRLLSNMFCFFRLAFLTKGGHHCWSFLSVLFGTFHSAFIQEDVLEELQLHLVKLVVVLRQSFHYIVFGVILLHRLFL